jgi:hypothetical protein
MEQTLIERTEVVVQDAIDPKHNGVKYAVKTDEAYLVHKDDRFIQMLEEVDIVTSEVVGDDSFYCWVTTPSGKMVGLWSENGQIKSWQNSSWKDKDDFFNPTFVSAWARNHPSTKSKDSDVITVTSTGQITMNLPATTSTVTKSYVDSTYSGIKVYTSPLVQGNDMYVIDNTVFNSVSMTSNGTDWKIIGQ